jgi:hypothetical protein
LDAALFSPLVSEFDFVKNAPSLKDTHFKLLAIFLVCQAPEDIIVLAVNKCKSCGWCVCVCVCVFSEVLRKQAYLPTYTKIQG